jgi:prepilin-type N-terminal cleavage/methylation domain-containing protein
MKAVGHRRAAGAFTLTELLVVIAILALLAAAGLPALCRTEAPVKLVRCMNNCRQLAAATLLYRNDYNDAYPFGTRFQSILQRTAWPMQLLPYLGATSNAQPTVFLCPTETATAGTWPIQLHYAANRMLSSDTSARDTPVRGAQVRNPTIYWLFMDKSPYDFASMTPGGLATALGMWNSPPGSPPYRRHSGGWTTAAADGHGEWLRASPCQPGRPSPSYFGELGDCSDGNNPASTWLHNGPWRIKLYCRENQTGFE